MYALLLVALIQVDVPPPPVEDVFLPPAPIGVAPLQNVKVSDVCGCGCGKVGCSCQVAQGRVYTTGVYATEPTYAGWRWRPWYRQSWRASPPVYVMQMAPQVQQAYTVQQPVYVMQRPMTTRVYSATVREVPVTVSEKSYTKTNRRGTKTKTYYRTKVSD